MSEPGYRYDPVQALSHLRGADPTLASLIDRVGPYRLQIKRAPTLFVALAESIVYQQLHAKAAATIFGRVCALFPGAGIPTPQRLARLSDEALRGAGLSRSKLLALRDLAERTQRGLLPSLEATREMDDEAIVEQLVPVRGIGRWTVQMLLIFDLGRPDVLPVEDYGIRQGFARTFRKRVLPEPADVARRGRRWTPYRTVASWYLWRANEVLPPMPPPRKPKT